jgi:hypothetical protein
MRGIPALHNRTTPRAHLGSIPVHAGRDPRNIRNFACTKPECITGAQLLRLRRKRERRSCRNADCGNAESESSGKLAGSFQIHGMSPLRMRRACRVFEAPYSACTAAFLRHTDGGLRCCPLVFDCGWLESTVPATKQYECCWRSFNVSMRQSPNIDLSGVGIFAQRATARRDWCSRWCADDTPLVTSSVRRQGRSHLQASIPARSNGRGQGQIYLKMP